MATTSHDESVDAREQVRRARTAGLLYLGLFITGILHLVIRGQIFDAGNPAATLSHLADREVLARLGIATELGLVIIQTLLALCFYRFFRAVNAFTAGAIAVFGLLNAVAILGSAALLATALDVALDTSLDGAATAAQLTYVVSGHLWGVVGVFFGLWLIPMGMLVLRSGWMPRPLGWFLVAGGAAYVVRTFLAYLVPEAESVASVLPWFATIGEFWIMAYLLIKGVRHPGKEQGRAADYLTDGSTPPSHTTGG